MDPRIWVWCYLNDYTAIILKLQCTGHAGFDPPHPSQKEEILTTTAVQDGYSFDTFPV
jgi:hypothetical protein